MRRRLLAALCTLAAAVAVAGCDRVAERAAEEAIGRAADADVDLDTDEGGVRVETDDGSLEIGAEGSLPDGFPEAFPLPPDLEIVNAGRVAEDGREAFSVTANTATAADEIASFFRDALPAAGWSIAGESDQQFGDDASQLALQVDGHGYEGGVVVLGGDDDEAVAVQITLSSGEGE
jgi:hypothetical protein